MFGRSYLEKFFSNFNALLTALFSLRRRLITRQGAQRCAPRSITALTALTIDLFQGREIFDPALTRFAARIFA